MTCPTSATPIWAGRAVRRRTHAVTRCAYTGCSMVADDVRPPVVGRRWVGNSLPRVCTVCTAWLGLWSGTRRLSSARARDMHASGDATPSSLSLAPPSPSALSSPHLLLASLAGLVLTPDPRLPGHLPPALHRARLPHRHRHWRLARKGRLLYALLPAPLGLAAPTIIPLPRALRDAHLALLELHPPPLARELDPAGRDARAPETSRQRRPHARLPFRGARALPTQEIKGAAVEQRPALAAGERAGRAPRRPCQLCAL